MANIYLYRGIVKGKPNAVHAFYGSLPCLDYKEIKDEKTLKNGDISLKFEGNCKWEIDAYTDDAPVADDFLSKLSDDAHIAEKQGEELLYSKSVSMASKILSVDVKICGADIDDNDPNNIQYDSYHVKNGEFVSKPWKIPSWMQIKAEDI